MRTTDETEAHIRLKVQDDADFRERLLQDPHGMILAETGVEPSNGQLLYVHNEEEKPPWTGKQ